MDEWVSALTVCIELFTAAAGNSSSGAKDHFAGLLRHMNDAKAICAKLLRLLNEFKELKMAYGATQKVRERECDKQTRWTGRGRVAG